MGGQRVEHGACAADEIHRCEALFLRERIYGCPRCAHRLPALGSDLSAADLCRANEWGVGTLLAGEEDGCVTVIQLTAIGEELILAKTVSVQGRAPWIQTRESEWTLSCRDWQEIDRA